MGYGTRRRDLAVSEDSPCGLALLNAENKQQARAVSETFGPREWGDELWAPIHATHDNMESPSIAWLDPWFGGVVGCHRNTRVGGRSWGIIIVIMEGVAKRAWHLGCSGELQIAWFGASWFLIFSLGCFCVQS